MNSKVVFLSLLLCVVVSGRRRHGGLWSGANDEICEDTYSTCMERRSECLSELGPDVFQIRDLEDFNACLTEFSLPTIDTSGSDACRLINDRLEELSATQAEDVQCCYWEEAGLVNADGTIDTSAVVTLLVDAIDDAAILAAFQVGVSTCSLTDCDMEEYGECLLAACINNS